MIGRRSLIKRILGGLAAAAVGPKVLEAAAAPVPPIVAELPLAPALRYFGPIIASGVPNEQLEALARKFGRGPMLEQHDAGYAMGRVLPDGTFRQFPNTFHGAYCPRRPAFRMLYRNDPPGHCLCGAYRVRPIP